MRKKTYTGDFNDRNLFEKHINRLKKCDQQIIDELLVVLKETNNFWIKNEIAIYLDKYDEERILDALVGEISKKESFNKNGVLVDACAKYDCTNYLQVFVNILLDEPGESYIWAMDVITNMGGLFENNAITEVLEQINSKSNEIIDKQKIKDLRYFGRYLKKRYG